ncbi:YqzH family protein [Bacillus sp. FJAT-29937]|uniref:YqzH family protein n=1 Tax=Bacillus sp. FJAT-29937 TaxID=1720553 RepID=UPI0008328B99|nr:YqzH family protein [Bacillus sp. FJAT-29937]
MDRKLIFKMIQTCLKQYNESISIDSVEFEEMYEKINLRKHEEKEIDLYDIVNDVLYGYISDSPYF